MTDTTVSFDEAAAGRQASESRGMDRSTIEFPYLDLDAAIDVAQAVYGRAGLGTCEIDELAAQMQQVVSGSFRLKTATAKTFGLIEKEGRSGIKLSALGQQAIQTDTTAEARVQAFLAVPLYKAVFDRYRGHLLPPAKALEREMAAFGVAPKQVDKARQAFERSARQAGFFAQGDDRLVQPRLDPPATRPLDLGEHSIEMHGHEKGGGGGGNSGGTHSGNRDASSEKPLEYQLIDLLKTDGISDPERAAVWTLVQFLTVRRDV
jgi:hypothetical protein